LKRKELAKQHREQFSVVTKWRVEHQAQRLAQATAFRQRLLSELPSAAGSASIAALVEVAVSAYTEMLELNERFMRSRAAPQDRTRLGLCRGQLQRALQALGLVEPERSATHEAPDPVASFERQRAAILATVAKENGDA
jgi:hypothetical protein